MVSYLGQVVIITVHQKRQSHSPHESLWERMKDVEGGHATGAALGGRSRHGSRQQVRAVATRYVIPLRLYSSGVPVPVSEASN
jgi:hypothetical protein